MPFGELNINGLTDTGALSSAILEADLRKIRLLVPHTILNEGLQAEFQIMFANGQLEAPIPTVEMQLEVGDITFREKFKRYDKPYQPFRRCLIPTMQQYHTRYASGNLELSFLFNANKKRRSDIPKCY